MSGPASVGGQETENRQQAAAGTAAPPGAVSQALDPGPGLGDHLEADSARCSASSLKRPQEWPEMAVHEWDAPVAVPHSQQKYCTRAAHGLSGEPIEQSVVLRGEPIKGTGETGTSHSTGGAE